MGLLVAPQTDGTLAMQVSRLAADLDTLSNFVRDLQNQIVLLKANPPVDPANADLDNLIKRLEDLETAQFGVPQTPPPAVPETPAFDPGTGAPVNDAARALVAQPEMKGPKFDPNTGRQLW